MSSTPENSYLILPRPQISVDVNPEGDLIIATVGMSDDYQRVETNEVIVPIDAAEEIANAILKLIGK